MEGFVTDLRLKTQYPGGKEEKELTKSSMTGHTVTRIWNGEKTHKSHAFYQGT